jgi:LysM repeat protein
VKRSYLCTMRSLVAVFFLISVFRVHAQSDELIIQGQTGGLYLEHTVVVKETWYSVGRMYNVDQKVLSKYNHLTFAHPLVVGQELKVPLTAANFSQDGKKTVGESLVPVFHIVQEKEWLYRISVNHNKVPIPALEKWNHVAGDQVHAGLHMIVGYLKVKTALSALAKRGVVPGAGGGAAPGGGDIVSEKMDSITRPASINKLPAKPAVTPAAAIGEKLAVDSPKAAATPTSRPVSTDPVPTTVASVSSLAPHFKGGRFKADFSDGGKSVAGQAGIFKSTSGWQDGKYYVLINNVSVGTIVKITDQSTGKSVYAKVLGQLPDMKESAGLTVRLSNAAAAELGEGDGRFGVGVSY